MAKTIFVFVCLLTTGALSGRVVGVDADNTQGYVIERDSEIDQSLAEIYKVNEPGAAVIAVKDGHVVHRKGYGMANLELGVALKPEMVFRLGSVTKQFTATAILMLVEQSKISFDDEITKFFPDYPTHGHKITIEHLLTHTSGIKSYTGIPDFMTKMRTDHTVKELIDTFKNQPMDFKPGEKYVYNNSGYFLLGAIIEKVSGKTYEEFIQKNIFQPLGMQHSYYGHNAPIISNRVSGYERDSKGFVNAPYLSMTQPYAAGSLLSSVDDLALWDAALYTEKMLKKDSFKRMFTPYKLSNGESTRYGYGWQISQFQGRPVVEHGWGINGFRTHVLRMPDDHVYVAVLTNCPSEVNPQYVAKKIAAIVMGKPVKESTAIKVDPTKLDTYVGVYKIDEKTNRVVTRDGDRLFVQRTGGPKIEVFPASEIEFFYKYSFNYLSFTRDDSGKVSRMVFHQDDKEEICPKTEQKPPNERKAIQLDPQLYDNLVGEYELAPGFVLTISREADKLMGQATGQPKVEVFPESETEFFLRVVDAQITFVKDSLGIVTSLILHQGGRDMPAKKIR